MMNNMKLNFAFAVVYILPLLINYSQSNRLNVSNGKLIFVDPLNYDNMFGMKENNFDGSSGKQAINRCICTTTKHCLCKGFDEALVQHVESNTIIAINSTITVNLSITFSNITNISIIGYHMMMEISCSTPRGYITFNNCDKITIENITWNQCGYMVYNFHLYGAIH